MIRYYDKSGKPIDLHEWAKLMDDNAYKQVASDEIDDVLVSTVWLGLNHQYGIGPPIIF